MIEDGFGALSLVGAEFVVAKTKDDRLLTENVTADKLPCPMTKSGQHQWIDGGCDCFWCGAHRSAQGEGE